MADSDGELLVNSAGDVLGTQNVLTRMGERVAALEARTQAEISALKRDTETIRNGNHELRNQLTEWFAVVKTQQAMLMSHVTDCNRRGARLERLAWAGITLVVGILIFLLKVHFFPGEPA